MIEMSTNTNVENENEVKEANSAPEVPEVLHEIIIKDFKVSNLITNKEWIDRVRNEYQTLCGTSGQLTMSLVEGIRKTGILCSQLHFICDDRSPMKIHNYVSNHDIVFYGHSVVCFGGYIMDLLNSDEIFYSCDYIDKLRELNPGKEIIFDTSNGRSVWFHQVNGPYAPLVAEIYDRGKQRKEQADKVTPEEN